MSAGASLRTPVPAQQSFGLFAEGIETFPQIRYMGSKYRLLPWLHEVLGGLRFNSALDAFSGSGCVAYLLKRMGKRVVTNDFLNFAYQTALATIENSEVRITQAQQDALAEPNDRRQDFIEKTFAGVFFTEPDLRFLDIVWSNLGTLPTAYHRALALTALTRSCVKRQPRGVFTVTGDPARYDDGRRDLQLSLAEHFAESIEIYNETVFDNGHRHAALRGDVLSLPRQDVDLVYMDPPYVPRADDNCYIKRYHFLEGLASYWTEEGTEILTETASRKIPKRYTPFSYRKTAIQAFEDLFARFKSSILVLSYSSNGYPDLDVLVAMMRKVKGHVEVHEKEHRYHFGTHGRVAADRTSVKEYLIVGA